MTLKDTGSLLQGQCVPGGLLKPTVRTYSKERLHVDVHVVVLLGSTSYLYFPVSFHI